MHVLTKHTLNVLCNLEKPEKSCVKTNPRREQSVLTVRELVLTVSYYTEKKNG